MEAPVETINKRTEVTGSVFGEIERMIGATQADLSRSHAPAWECSQDAPASRDGTPARPPWLPRGAW